MDNDSISTNGNKSFISKIFYKINTDVKEFIIDYKGSIIIILVFIFISELSDKSIIDLFIKLMRFITYPVNLLLFNTDFGNTKVPEVFFLLVPLMVIFLLGFSYIIVSED